MRLKYQFYKTFHPEKAVLSNSDCNISINSAEDTAFLPTSGIWNTRLIVKHKQRIVKISPA